MLGPFRAGGIVRIVAIEIEFIADLESVDRLARGAHRGELRLDALLVGGEVDLAQRVGPPLAAALFLAEIGAWRIIRGGRPEHRQHFHAARMHQFHEIDEQIEGSCRTHRETTLHGPARSRPSRQPGAPRNCQACCSRQPGKARPWAPAARPASTVSPCWTDRRRTPAARAKPAVGPARRPLGAVRRQNGQRAQFGIARRRRSRAHALTTVGSGNRQCLAWRGAKPALPQNGSRMIPLHAIIRSIDSAAVTADPNSRLGARTAEFARGSPSLGARPMKRRRWRSPRR